MFRPRKIHAIFAIFGSLLVVMLLAAIAQQNVHLNLNQPTNISVCYFCDEGVDFSVRNFGCCALHSRCCFDEDKDWE